jgi:hypothetical protein
VTLHTTQALLGIPPPVLINGTNLKKVVSSSNIIPGGKVTPVRFSINDNLFNIIITKKKECVLN